MVIPYVFKKCTKCGEWLVASSVNFRKRKDGKYGLRANCKECDKRYREANKEVLSEKNKKWRKENKDYFAEYRKQNKDYFAERKKKYRETHKEAIAEYDKKYRQTPQGQVVAFNKHNRRRAREQAQGNGITKEQWLECMSFFEFRCAYSGITLSKNTRSVDHIKPISKGGENEIWNLVPMYKSYNCSKNTKDFLTWYQEQEYFSEERLDKIYEWQEYAFNKWGRENLTEAE